MRRFASMPPARSSSSLSICMRTQWAIAGASEKEMAAREKAAWAAGKLHEPKAGAMCYMMSGAPISARDRRGIRMSCSTSRIEKASSWGANLPKVPISGAASDHATIFSVIVPYWSDGTPEIGRRLGRVRAPLRCAGASRAARSRRHKHSLSLHCLTPVVAAGTLYQLVIYSNRARVAAAQQSGQHTSPGGTQLRNVMGLNQSVRSFRQACARARRTRRLRRGRPRGAGAAGHQRRDHAHRATSTTDKSAPAKSARQRARRQRNHRKSAHPARADDAAAAGQRHAGAPGARNRGGHGHPDRQAAGRDRGGDFGDLRDDSAESRES